MKSSLSKILEFWTLKNNQKLYFPETSRINLAKSVRSSNSETSLNNSQSKSKTSSSSWSASRKRTKAELLLQQSQERFERKWILLERQKSLKLELKRENILNKLNKLKSMQLKVEFLTRPYSFKFFKGCLPQILLGPFLNTLTQMSQQEKSLSGIETQILSPSQTANEKVKNYLSSFNRKPCFTKIYLGQSPKPKK